MQGHNLTKIMISQHSFCRPIGYVNELKEKITKYCETVEVGVKFTYMSWSMGDVAQLKCPIVNSVWHKKHKQVVQSRFDNDACCTVFSNEGRI